MPLESILKRVINEPGKRSECSVYISIVLAYMEKQNWVEARIFLKLAYQTWKIYEEQLVLRLIEDILESENVRESLLLLASIKWESE